MKKEDDGNGKGETSTNPFMKKIRLFALKGGVELMDKDFMFAVHGHKYLFYSMGKLDFIVFYFCRRGFRLYR